MNYPVGGARGRRAAGKATSGLSLLEVVISIALLSSLALGSLLVFVPISRQSRVNREISLANFEARRVLEKVHAVPFKDVTTLYADGLEYIIPTLPEGKVRTSYEDPNSDPLVLRVAISWESPELGSMQRTFFTVRTE